MKMSVKMCPSKMERSPLSIEPIKNIYLNLGVHFSWDQLVLMAYPFVSRNAF